MRIEHVAFWTEDLERLAGFYQRYFGATVGDNVVLDPDGNRVEIVA